MSDGDAKIITLMAGFLTKVVGDPERGLEEIDAAAISNVFLYELVQNVIQHADSGGPALVAAWARPHDRPPVPSQYLENEQAYFRWFGEEPKPLIELIVGDSGAGIISKLRPAFERAKKKGRSVPNLGGEPDADVLAWALDRWSTGRSDDHLRGTRGLYRVDRVASKYDGLVSLRTASHLLVNDHGGPGYHSQGVQSGLRLIPGSLLRLWLPPFREKPPSRPHSPSRTERKPILLKLGPVTEEGIGKEACDKLREVVQRQTEHAASGEPSRPVVVTFSGGVAKHEAVVLALEEAARLRHPPALALTGLPGGWDLVTNAVNSINESIERAHADREWLNRNHYRMLDPVLVIGSPLEFKWVGASTDTRVVLDSLLKSSSGSIHVDQVVELIPEADRRRPVLQQLREDWHLTPTPDGEQLHLLLTPQGVFESTSDSIQRELENQGVGVNPGPWVTPALCEITQWVDIDRLLQSTVGSTLPMLALADNLRRFEEKRSFSLLLHDPAASESRLKFLETFLGNVRSEPMQREATAARAVEIIRHGTRVAFFTETITSGEAVVRALATVLRNGGHPCLVACLIDGRIDPTEPIELWGKKIKVISIVRHRLLAELEPRPLFGKAINPITLSRERPAPELSGDDLPIPQEEMYRLITSEEALHFSHIGRKVGRHFTFYLHVPKLCINERVLSAIDETIDRWLDAPDDDGAQADTTFDIWYPASKEEREHPAQLLAEAIDNRRCDVSTHRAIQRIATDETWLFPKSVGASLESPSRNLLIVDWGSYSGTNLMELVRSGSGAGAKRILVCVIVSQLSEEREIFLRSVSRIRAPGRQPPGFQEELPVFSKEGGIGRDEPGLEEDFVSVQIEFMSRVQIGIYSRHTCPVCQQRRRLAGLESLPEGLGHFDDETRGERLRLRARHDVLGLPSPVDLDGRPLTGEAVAWMLDFRGKLEAAIRSTLVRMQVVNELDRLVVKLEGSGRKSEAKALWLIRFLSIESQWLKTEPLSLHRSRGVLAKIALVICCNRAIEERDRISAVIVLRATSKRIFAANLADLLVASLSSFDVAYQVLYSVLTILSRPYLEESAILNRLRRGLAAARERIESQANVPTGKLAEALNFVGEHVSYRSARADTVEISLPKAWHKLRSLLSEKLYPSHGTVPEHFRYLSPGPDAADIDSYLAGKIDRLTEDVEDWIRYLPANWQPCSEFLERELLPLVQRLKTVLNSPDGRRVLGGETVARLIELSKLPHPISQWSFSQLLTSVSERPQRLLTDINWSLFKSELDFLWDGVLRPSSKRSPNNTLESPFPAHPLEESRLISFLGTCPTSLQEVISEVLAELHSQTPSCNVDLKRFEEARDPYSCFATRDLVWAALNTLLGNCEKHRSDKQRFIQVDITVWRLRGRIKIEVVNDNTHESRDPGKGLRQLTHRLRCFGGDLLPEPLRATVGPTYKASVYLLEAIS